jgi:hypothetical protein
MLSSENFMIIWKSFVYDKKKDIFEKASTGPEDSISSRVPDF